MGPSCVMVPCVPVQHVEDAIQIPGTVVVVSRFSPVRLV